MNRAVMCDCHVEIPKPSVFCTRSPAPDGAIKYYDQMADPSLIPPSIN